MRKCIAMLMIVFVGSCKPAKDVSREYSAPQRIVSLAPAITQKLYLLGVDKRLVANTVYCNLPEDAKNKVKIGNVIQVNIEAIVTLKPDLVIAANLTRPEQVEKLETLGIRVVRCLNPKSFAEMCDEFVELGKIVGAQERAEQIVAQVNADVADIRKLTADVSRKRVFIQIGSKPLFTVTKDSFVNDYIEYAGGENIASQERSGIYSREKVVKENPDIIIVTTMGIVGEAEKKVWMKYPTITAVANKNIHVLDSYKVCSPTPVIFVDMLREIAKILHPEL
jgi:iron complex transport system substrate-binding protein